MLTADSEVCLVLKSEDEIAFFQHMLNKMGYSKVRGFSSTEEALKIILQQQFDFFVTRMESDEMSGIVMVQKMRATGNYGLETHLFIADRIDTSLVNTLAELDMPYVLVKPFNYDRFAAKVKHLIQIENNLSEFESHYRNAKGAITGNLLEMAESMLEEMAKIDAENEKTLGIAGDIALHKKDYAKAQQNFEKILAKNPNSAVAAHRLGAVHMAEGAFDKAAKILDQLAATNSYNIRLLENAGLSNLKIGNVKGAEEQMTKIRELDSTNKFAGEVLSDIYVQRGDFKSMQKVLASSHDEKELISYLNNAGVRLAKENDFQGAIKMYESCLETIKDNKYAYAVYYNLGIAYKKLKNLTKAREFLVKSIELEPDYEKAIKALKSLG